MNYITYFDENYVAKAIIMWNSLKKLYSSDNLYVLFLSKKAFKLWNKVVKNDFYAIYLDQIEDEQLLKVKKNREKVEYYWTLTPFWVDYCLDVLNLNEFVYVDADLEFFNDTPELNILKSKYDVLITPHNYNPLYDQSKESGIYCVQYIYFKNTEVTKKIVLEWKSQCINWCYNRVENGKFGDQKYLEDWTINYPNNVGIIKDQNFFLAPWNWQTDILILRNIDLKKIHFIHWHGVKVSKYNYYINPPYVMDDEAIKKFNKKYLTNLFKLSKILNFYSNYYEKKYLTEILKNLKKILFQLKILIKILLKIPVNFSKFKYY